MKPKVNIKSIWITTILSLGLLVFGIIQCSAQVYTTFSFDVNNLLDIKDNPRMETQVNGLDYKIEAGAIDNNIGVFVYYGMFYNANYQCYCAGVDYYVNITKSIYGSVGNSYNVVIRSKEQKHLGTTSSYVNPRFKLGVDTGWITVELIAKLTKRNEINKRIAEGSVGFLKKFN